MKIVKMIYTCATVRVMWWKVKQERNYSLGCYIKESNQTFHVTCTAQVKGGKSAVKSKITALKKNIFYKQNKHLLCS